MASDGVGRFVAHDGGEASVGFSDGEDAGVDADFAAGEAEGVDVFAFEDGERPVVFFIGGLGDEFANADDLGRQRAVLGNRFLAAHVLIGGFAHLVHVAFGDGDKLFAAGHWRRDAGGERRGGHHRSKGAGFGDMGGARWGMHGRTP